MAKKLRYQDLREDPFRKTVVDTTGMVAGFAKRRGTLLLVVAGAVAVSLLAVAVVLTSARRSEARAHAELAAALGDLDKAQAAAAATTPPAAGEEAPPSWDEVIAKLSAVASEHRRTRAGELAVHWRGIAELQAGRHAAAAATLASFSSAHPDHWILPHSLAALAVAQESAGSLDEARATLERLAGRDWRSFPRAAAVHELASFHERHGNLAAAREQYQKLATEEAYAESAYSSQAKAALERLGDG